MSTQPRPPRAYSFPPLFRGASFSQQMRVSDAERQAVVDRLAEHFADGRLDHAEFDERVGRAMSAKTQADLNRPVRRPARAQGRRRAHGSGRAACLPAGPALAPSCSLRSWS